MNRFLKARERAVGDILSPKRRLYVPSFQRFYEWSAEEAGDLLGDIQTAQTEAGARQDETPPCFLGCTVLVQDVGDDLAMIVDGQQRLTTITMMLAILRDLAERDLIRCDAAERDGAEEPLETPRIDRDLAADQAGRLAAYVLTPRQGAPEPRDTLFRPRSLDRRFFYETIQRPGATLTLTDETLAETDAQMNMRDAAMALKRVIDELSAMERVWLAEYILRRCYMVEVTAPFEDQAYKVFMSLNARGKNLKPSGLLKAELLGKVPLTRQVEFRDMWEDLEAKLGEANFVSLFSHLRMIENPGKANRSVVAELREALNPSGSPEQFMRRHLEPKGRILLELVNASLSAGSQTHRLRPLLQSMARLPNRDWAPPAIAFLSEGRPSPDEVAAFFTGLERLAYGMFIQGGSENQRLSRYAKVIEKIREKANVETLVAQMALTRNDVRLVKSVLNGTIYNKERVRGPVLLRIDEHLTDSVARYDVSKVTVEHVLPRNPPEDSPWREAWPRAEDRRIWTDRLGNLALLSRERNGKAGNFPFPQKKREYFHQDGMTPFAITTQVLLETEWTPEVVQARHQRLFRAACSIWDL